MKFSLVIPSYNRAALLGHTLRSALEQTVAFDEIIVVDDGSTDNTAEVVALIGSKQIRYIHTPNQGVQRARNTGVAAARNERVAFCDSDDLLEPEFVEVTGNWLASHPGVDTTYTNFSTFGARPWYPDKFFAAPDGYFDGARLEQGFYVGDPELYIKAVRYPCMWVTGMTVHKPFYEAIGGFDPAFHRVVTEDWEFNLRALSRGRTALCRRVLARVRYHSGSQSDNTLRTHLGATKVLRHAMETHPGADRYAAEMQQAIEWHYTRAFNLAFAQGDFLAARYVLEQQNLGLEGPRFQWKRRILTWPEPLRRASWKTVQWASSLRVIRSAG